MHHNDKALSRHIQVNLKLLRIKDQQCFGFASCNCYFFIKNAPVLIINSFTNWRCFLPAQMSSLTEKRLKRSSTIGRFLLTIALELTANFKWRSTYLQCQSLSLPTHLGSFTIPHQSWCQTRLSPPPSSFPLTSLPSLCFDLPLFITLNMSPPWAGPKFKYSLSKSFATHC